MLFRSLRWANIGWFYNWGTKKYEFDRGKIEIGEPIRSICKEIVSSVEWSSVFSSESVPLNEYFDWGETGPDWRRWDSTYGKNGIKGWLALARFLI